MIISLHIHKCAGSSFLKYLGRSYGNHTVSQVEQGFGCDTNIYTMLQNIKPTTGVFHGHIRTKPWFDLFSPEKNTYITWIREPLKRIISEYYYIHEYNYKKYPRWEQYFQNKDNIPFEDYCFLPETQNFISDHFNVNGIYDLHKFKFVGVSDYFDKELLYLSRNVLRVNADRVPVINKNKNIDKKLFDEVNSVVDNSDFINRFKSHHQLDYEFYNYALKGHAIRFKS